MTFLKLASRSVVAIKNLTLCLLKKLKTSYSHLIDNQTEICNFNKEINFGVFPQS